jgi:hypothetical protein
MVSFGMLRRVALVRSDLCMLLVPSNVVPNSPIFVTLMKKTLSSSQTSVLTRATRRNIPGDAILHGHRRGNLKSDTNMYAYVIFHIHVGGTYPPHWTESSRFISAPFFIVSTSFFLLLILFNFNLHFCHYLVYFIDRPFN